MAGLSALFPHTYTQRAIEPCSTKADPSTLNIITYYECPWELGQIKKSAFHEKMARSCIGGWIFLENANNSNYS
jgi:hypothetical protein